MKECDELTDACLATIIQGTIVHVTFSDALDNLQIIYGCPKFLPT